MSIHIIIPWISLTVRKLRRAKRGQRCLCAASKRYHFRFILFIEFFFHTRRSVYTHKNVLRVAFSHFASSLGENRILRKCGTKGGRYEGGGEDVHHDASPPRRNYSAPIRVSARLCLCRNSPRVLQIACKTYIHSVCSSLMRSVSLKSEPWANRRRTGLKRGPIFDADINNVEISRLRSEFIPTRILIKLYQAGYLVCKRFVRGMK